MNFVPPHLTGDPTTDWIILGAGFLILLYWLRALRLAREGARTILGNLVISGAVFLGVTIYLSRNYSGTGQQDEILAGLAALVFFFFLQKLRRRSRYIPRSVRQAVIARDLKGEEFDPQRHHIDHVWPYSKGGSNTADNLRVIAKSRNLRKRAKRPRIWEMW